MTKIRITQIVHITKDSYNEGEIGPYQIAEHGHLETVESFEKALDYIENFTGHVPYIFEDRLEVTILETADRTEATSAQIEAWQNEQLELYSVTYSFYLEQVIDVNNDQLKEAFGQLERC